MEKLLKKLMALVGVGCILIGQAAFLSGCDSTAVQDPERFNEDVDTAKTQLYIGYYNGGLGLDWLKEIKARFEDIYPEYQVMIDTGKEEYESEALRSNIKTNRQDLYVIDGFNYYTYINDGTLLDLTEATTTPLTEYGEDRSIADKMNASLKAFYETADSKYYAVPLHQSYHHMVYDVDLFDQYNLWYKDGGGFVASAEDQKSAGQDGEYGTWDDGLPVTYSEFFALLDRMVARGITPFTWTGMYADSYLTNFIASAIASYEGEQYATNWSYEGEISVITNKDFAESEAKTFTLDPSTYETVTVSLDNYKDNMHSTAGKYFAAKLAKDICSNPAYRTYNFAESHTAVQRSYLMSNMEGVDKPVAMLIEGNWWINESKSVFEEMATYGEKYSMENRRFGIMPFPKADDGSSADGCTFSPYSGTSAVFISEKSPNKDAAVKFYRFMHTEECLQLTTKYSYVMRPFDCDLDAIYDELPYYVQNSIDIAETASFIYRLPTNNAFKEDPDVLTFLQYGGFMNSDCNGISTNNMMLFFCDYGDVTALDYLKGLESAYARTMPLSLG